MYPTINCHNDYLENKFLQSPMHKHHKHIIPAYHSNCYSLSKQLASSIRIIISIFYCTQLFVTQYIGYMYSCLA